MLEHKMLELFIVRDANDGAILHVTDDRDDGEDNCVGFVGSWATKDGKDIPTVPILEVYEIDLGNPAEVLTAASLTRRVATRKRRQDREFAAYVAKAD